MKREGFTLIELITVVAIIIILATIAIPNYLKVTDRARKARLAADLKTIATALDSFKTDWGRYPAIRWNIPVSRAGNATDLTLFNELTGSGTGNSLQNKPGKRTIFGDLAHISYLKPGTLLAIRNPLNSRTTGGASGIEDQSVVYYVSNDDSSGKSWALWVYGPKSGLYYSIRDTWMTLTPSAGRPFIP